MGVLRYAILGLLNRRDMTGYDLTKEFQASLSEFWSAKHSQIYPELRALADEGLVTWQVAISGTVLEKKLYSITEQGKKELHRWQCSDAAIPALPKDEFKLRLFFSDSVSPEQRIRMLENQLIQHREKLAHLKKNAEQFSGSPPADACEFSDYLVYLGAVSREQAACEWLEKCIALSRQREQS